MNSREIIEILRDTGPADELFRKADTVRRERCGDGVHLRGIIEFSNHCARNCLYCGLRAGNTKVRRYRLSDEEIFASAGIAARAEIRTVVLQSGEDPFFTADRLCGIVRGIKERAGCAVTLSVGERTKEEYKELKAAGADRFLLRFETSDPGLFARLRPGASYENRFQCLRWLKQAGFQTGSGIMIGLPGQTFETLANDLLRFKEFELDMVGVGPFIPHPDTPLGGEKRGTMELTLKIVALTRLLLPDTHIPATTAMGTIDPQGRQKALRCGANVIMPNLSPVEHRRDYSIYPDKICVTEAADHCAQCVDAMINSLGRRKAPGFGHSLKNNITKSSQGSPT